LLCGSRARGKFSLLTIRFIACKSNMLLRFLWGIIKFMIVYFFVVLTFSNLVECLLTPPKVFFFFPIINPRIQKM
jgi:hypothetical protein